MSIIVIFFRITYFYVNTVLISLLTANAFHGKITVTTDQKVSFQHDVATLENPKKDLP